MKSLIAGAMFFVVLCFVHWFSFHLGRSSIKQHIVVRNMHWPSDGITYFGKCAWSGEPWKSQMFCAKLDNE